MNITELLDNVSAIPWDSPNVSLFSKKLDFFEVLDDFFNLITYGLNLNYFGFTILIINIVRLCMCMDCHPRLALLTSTVSKAGDDIVHAFLIVITLLAAFSAVATWRFAYEFPGFHTFGQSFCSLFLVVLGDLPEDFGTTPELAIFLTTYILVLFFLVQNFVLAIIVEAYMAVRQDNKDLKTEQTFFEDVWDSISAYVFRYCYGWPNRGALGDLLETYKCKHTIGFHELRLTKMFGSDHSIITFLTHYSKVRFSWLPFGMYMLLLALPHLAASSRAVLCSRRRIRT